MSTKRKKKLSGNAEPKELTAPADRERDEDVPVPPATPGLVNPAVLQPGPGDPMPIPAPPLKPVPTER
jgi:hypothetical protein